MQKSKVKSLITGNKGFTPTSPPKPMNFTQMPAVCVCGKDLTLLLQEPSLGKISWHTFCRDCHWHVSVVLHR